MEAHGSTWKHCSFEISWIYYDHAVLLWNQTCSTGPQADCWYLHWWSSKPGNNLWNPEVAGFVLVISWMPSQMLQNGAKSQGVSDPAHGDWNGNHAVRIGLSLGLIGLLKLKHITQHMKSSNYLWTMNKHIEVFAIGTQSFEGSEIDHRIGRAATKRHFAKAALKVLQPDEIGSTSLVTRNQSPRTSLKLP